jgi:hypothetical protein
MSPNTADYVFMSQLYANNDGCDKTSLTSAGPPVHMYTQLSPDFKILVFFPNNFVKK